MSTPVGRGLTLAIPIGFLHLRHTRGGGVGTTPLAISPLVELERRGKNERVARHETQRLVPRNKVKGQPVTSEVRSMTSRHGLSLSPITSHVIVVEQKFKRHRVCLEKTHRMMYFVLRNA